MDSSDDGSGELTSNINSNSTTSVTGISNNSYAQLIQFIETPSNNIEHGLQNHSGQLKESENLILFDEGLHIDSSSNSGECSISNTGHTNDNSRDSVICHNNGREHWQCDDSSISSTVVTNMSNDSSASNGHALRFPKDKVKRRYIHNDAYNFWLIILLALLFILLVIISFLQHGRWNWFGMFLFFAIPISMILLSFAVISDTYCSGRCNLWSSGVFWFYIISSVLLVGSVMSSGGNPPRTTAMIFTILCLMSLIVLLVLLSRTSISLIILSMPSIVVILLFYIYLV